MTKSDREVMEILEAYDLTRCAHSAARLCGVDEKTVARYVAIRDAGGDPFTRPRRVRAIDPFLPKVEEWVEDVAGADPCGQGARAADPDGVCGQRADHPPGGGRVEDGVEGGPSAHLSAVDPRAGDVAAVRLGRGAAHRGAAHGLFCAWLAWSRFRVVIPVWDQTLGTLVACLDTTLRRLGGAPTYLLTDNAKTVTVEHIAGVAVRHPQMVAAGRHYGCKVETCRPYRPGVQGRRGEHGEDRQGGPGARPRRTCSTPTTRFAELVEACEELVRSGQRPGAPGDRRGAGGAAGGRAAAPARAARASRYALALGEERLVDDDQTIRFGSVRYSTPPGHVGSKVWCRVVGEELAIVARTGAGLVEIARHRLSTPGNPRIVDAHYPAPPRREPCPARPRSGPARGRGRVPRPRRRARTTGWSRPPPPARNGSGRRWPARSSSPPSSVPGRG